MLTLIASEHLLLPRGSKNKELVQCRHKLYERIPLNALTFFRHYCCSSYETRIHQFIEPAVRNTKLPPLKLSYRLHNTCALPQLICIWMGVWEVLINTNLKFVQKFGRSGCRHNQGPGIEFQEPLGMHVVEQGKEGVVVSPHIQQTNLYQTKVGQK